ncbi:MAG: hypothetical protein AAF526_01635 [Pseudomonadota bacterium]
MRGNLGFASGVIGLALAGGEVSAGAWTRAPGDGLVIFSSGRRVAPVGAFAASRPDDDANTTQVLVEYGLLDSLTIGATVFADISTVDIDESSLNAGVFVRKRFWKGEQGVFSGQIGYAHPFEDLIGGNFGTNASSAPELEFRLLYGHSLWGNWGNAFVSFETGYDHFMDDERDEFRTDLTVGYEPFHCCLALLSFFATVPRGLDNATLKIAPSFAYTLWPGISRNGKKPEGPIRPRTIQFGINYDILNPDDGIGLQLSIWQRF